MIATVLSVLALIVSVLTLIRVAQQNRMLRDLMIPIVMQEQAPKQPRQGEDGQSENPEGGV